MTENTTTKTPAQILGEIAEEKACQYLAAQGLRLITRNYSCRLGEIDLIFSDKTDLVFVEVRYRKSAYFGTAADSVNYRKQRKLIRAALHYIQRKSISATVPCRFDVIAVSPRGKELDIEWIQNAFGVESDF